jgi:D,D-heptose 1,7-bisphosphate phosphatase
MALVILAGGLGTRLKERLGNKPKALIEIAGKPLLYYQLSLAAQSSISDVHLLVGYGAQMIRDYAGDGSRWGLSIHYHEEPQPLGTAGAVLHILDQLPEQFIVMYGDTMLDVDLHRLISFHRAHHAAATLFVHPNDHPQDSDLVEVDEAKRIIAFHPYPHSGKQYFSNLVSAALYVVEKKALGAIHQAAEILDFGKHVFPHLLQEKQFPLFGYKSPEYIKDVGTPARIDAVEKDYISGKIQKRRWDVSKKAIFLDRDGTINRHVGYVSRPEQFELLPNVTAAIREINRSGYLAVVVTNQPVIARGEATIEQLHAIHQKMETLLGREGAFIDALYYCPHHPDKGFLGERKEYKMVCECRKPGIGLLKQAQQDFHIDLAESWLVGDSTVDVECANRAGIKSILLRADGDAYDGKFDTRPNIECVDLFSAVHFILKE